MSEQQQEYFLKLIVGFQCDGLSESERIEFESLLVNDEQCRHLFMDIQRQSMAIAECFQSDAIVSGRPDSPGASSMNPLTLNVEPKSIYAHFAQPLAAILALAVCLGAAIAFFSVQSEPQPETMSMPKVGVQFAKLTFSDGAVWGDEESTEVSLGGSLKADTPYCLTAGLARLEMAGGGIVTLSAPSCFRGIGPEEIELVSGKIAARLPDLESALSVRVGQMTVHDSGRAFGVTAEADGDFDVSVFDGSVSVLCPGLDGTDYKQQVNEGKSLTAIDDQLNNHDEPFNAIQYQDLWPLTIGINDASSIIEFTLPGPQQPLTELANSKKLLLIPEQLNKQIGKSLDLYAVHPGMNWPKDQPKKIYIKPEAVISSYLLVYVPESSETLPSHAISGSISFERKILGVVIQEEPLEKSDRIFGVEDIDYASLSWRRLERDVTDEGNVPADSIHISADGRQLYFNLHVSTGQDSIRVLVDESIP